MIALWGLILTFVLISSTKIASVILGKTKANGMGKSPQFCDIFLWDCLLLVLLLSTFFLCLCRIGKYECLPFKRHTFFLPCLLKELAEFDLNLPSCKYRGAGGAPWANRGKSKFFWQKLIAVLLKLKLPKVLEKCD